MWSGGVNTWECDEMGHLNVRFWVAKAMEALAGLTRVMGMPDAFARSGGATLVIRDLHMRFLREARAGACLWASGGIVALGEADADILVVLHHADGAPAATFRIRAGHATASDLRPFPWPARIRTACAALAIEVPDFAAPRSIDLSPLQETRASLGFAEAHGMTRIGLGTVRADELDVFGRMRPEMFIGRVSDGVGRLFGPTRPGLTRRRARRPRALAAPSWSTGSSTRDGRSPASMWRSAPASPTAPPGPGGSSTGCWTRSPASPGPAPRPW